MELAGRVTYALERHATFCVSVSLLQRKQLQGVCGRRSVARDVRHVDLRAELVRLCRVAAKAGETYLHSKLLRPDRASGTRSRAFSGRRIGPATQR
jgi:hypothetical protein